MSQLIAFSQKELLDIMRSGKFFVLLILFVLFGIMNPALTKLTPWLMEIMAEQLAQTGIVVVDIPVDAMTSWLQFYKNVPMSMIIFVILTGGILTTEYQHGTLINMVSKGLKRWKIIVAKLVTLTGLWTFLYWVMFGITYAYNAYFWGDEVIQHIWLSGGLVYLFGILIIVLVILFSVLFRNVTSVIGAVGGVVAGLYFVSIVPTIGQYLPTQLLSAQNLLIESGMVSDYHSAIAVTVTLLFISIFLSIIIFNKKAL